MNVILVVLMAELVHMVFISFWVWWLVRKPPLMVNRHRGTVDLVVKDALSEKLGAFEGSASMPVLLDGSEATSAQCKLSAYIKKWARKMMDDPTTDIASLKEAYALLGEKIGVSGRSIEYIVYLERKVSYNKAMEIVTVLAGEHLEEFEAWGDTLRPLK